MPISATLLTVLFLVALGVLALAGIKESASAAAAVFVFHARLAFPIYARLGSDTTSSVRFR